MRKISNLLMATIVCIVAILGFGCSQKPNTNLEINIIPKPQEVKILDGAYRLEEEITFKYPSELDTMFRTVIWDLVNLTGMQARMARGGEAVDLELTKVKGLASEGYRLKVTSNGVKIEASEEAGFFYGIQSLLQLTQQSHGDWVVPAVSIIDQPRFEWRGMHLDVSRHFFSVEEIKKYLDHLAAYKINTFHWHLTDDQGWRLEIKKYPKLTEVGAWRQPIGFALNQTKGLNEDNGEPYGGFYTQDDVREIVEYARYRQITVVPEIEMPGHTSAVLQAYPELACENAPPAKIWTDGGVSKHLFNVGSEETFTFLEDVLIEVMDLFPSTYIHIGGDEAPKDQWENCGQSQKRMKDEGLADEHELQSYFIRRIEKFLNENGRSIVGWDEILEGGLAPNATVMSWRGEAGGIAAAKAGHNAIMTPETPLYFNHRPIDRENAPGHYSRNNTIRTVYDYDPVSKELTQEEGKYIIGVQANMWVEHIPKWEHVESLLFPRFFALSEIAWTNLENKDYQNFELRLPAHVEKIEKKGVRVGKDYAGVIFSSELVDGNPQLAMSTALSNLDIRYTVDGSQPNNTSQLYQGPLSFDKTYQIKAASFRSDQMISYISSTDYISHLGIGTTVSYSEPYAERYDAGGVFGLVDGQYGYKELSWKGWQGWQQPKVELMIDLGAEKSIDEISVGFLSFQRKWIFYPEKLNIGVSKNGESFEEVFSYDFENPFARLPHEELKRPLAENLNSTARFVKVTIENSRKLPAWHTAAGQQPWIFIDEVVIN